MADESAEVKAAVSLTAEDLPESIVPSSFGFLSFLGVFLDSLDY